MHPGFFAVHDAHPWLVLIGLACFPRITLLFVGGPFSVLQWFGWALAPHFTVAMMATLMYWHTNPALVCVAWVCAFGGTSSEGKATRSVSRRLRRRRARHE